MGHYKIQLVLYKKRDAPLATSLLAIILQIQTQIHQYERYRHL